MDFELTHEQSLIVETVRRFVEHDLYPHEDTVEQLGRVPEALAYSLKQKAREMGIFAPNMPRDVGGAGVDAVTWMLIERELGRAAYALQYLAARPSNALQACTGEQIERYLLPTVRGERLDCVAMTEPEAGSDLRAMKTTAVRDGEHYVINGTKHFISKADIADFVILFAATGEESTERGARKLISSFLVDMGTPGFTVSKGYRSISHHGYNNCILTFDAVRVPVAQLLGEEHRGLEVAKRWLGSTRLQVAAMCLGRAHRALELATEWAATRRQFGQVISDYQGVSFKLADMATELAAAELLTFQVAWKMERGLARARDPAMAKLFATEMLGRVADNAVQILGGMGVMEETPIARIWRDARVERIWDGTSEIQRHIISRDLLRAHGNPS